MGDRCPGTLEPFGGHFLLAWIEKKMAAEEIPW